MEISAGFKAGRHNHPCVVMTQSRSFLRASILGRRLRALRTWKRSTAFENEMIGMPKLGHTNKKALYSLGTHRKERASTPSHGYRRTQRRTNSSRRDSPSSARTHPAQARTTVGYEVSGPALTLTVRVVNASCALTAVIKTRVVPDPVLIGRHNPGCGSYLLPERRATVAAATYPLPSVAPQRSASGSVPRP